MTALVHESTKQGLLYPVKDQSLLQVQVHKEIPVLNLTFLGFFFTQLNITFISASTTLALKKTGST